MLTYVINTSENKTFDTSKIFELAGYSKIRWIQCSLGDIQKCTEYICERQNNITSDNFRIAVIVDFFGFDRIRLPYGRRGFASDEGVDMSLYMPYIEVYLLDKLVLELENRELYAHDFEIYYVQNEKSERYELFNSAPTQIRQILAGKGGKRAPTKEELEAMAEREISDKEVDEVFGKAKKRTKKKAEDSELDEKEYSKTEEDQQREKSERLAKKVEMLLAKKSLEELSLYSSFTLYCTPEISLDFPLIDFPYGALEMNFEDFWYAFRDRVAIKTDLRRHYYITPYGGGPSRAALHTLSLSLYLIHLYEREESSAGEGDMDVQQIDSRVLCEVLEKGWSKINAAKIVAKKNNMEYYSLVSNSDVDADNDDEEEVEAEIAIRREKALLKMKNGENKKSGQALYNEIEEFALRTIGELKDRNREEFDKIMGEYLLKRDETRESDIEAEFQDLKNGGFLDTTPQCPSREQYNYIIKEKQLQISALFEKVLASEYIEVDYTAEKEKADEAYLEYKKAKAWLRRNIIGDIIFLLLAVASMVLPYYFLQLTAYSAKVMSSILLALNTSAFFAGIFLCAIMLQLIPIRRKLKKAEAKLYSCYLDCCAKERYSFSSIRRRYQKDLLLIEKTRYDIRQIKHLFDENLEKEKNVLMHREMLDNMADCLSSMLNNLDVEPSFDPDETVDGEFDLRKPLHSKENKVYQIFSIETIEKIFNKKGRDQE